MDGSQNLIIDSAATWTDTLWAQHANIQDLSGIEHFVNITGLDVLDNDLTFIPDLSSITNLKTLVVDSNNIDSIAPINMHSSLYIFKCDANNLDELPDLTGLTNLDRIFCRANNLKALPDLSTLSNLDKIICTYNQITSLPDLSASPTFTRLICHNNLLTDLPDYSLHPTFEAVLGWANQLTFEDILLMTKHPGFSTDYTVKPQDSIIINSVFDFIEGTNAIIDLGFDDTVTTNTYSWYKDGNPLTITTTNQLTLPNISLTDSGTYHVVVNNSHPQLSSHVITTKKFPVTVAPCINSDNADYNIVQENCERGTTVSIVSNSIDINSGLQYFQTVSQSKDTTTFSTEELYELEEGTYNLVITDINNCSRTIPSFITIAHIAECDPTFTPNGDGNNDSFYINETGRARIFNISGELIGEMQTPGYWDGTTYSGTPAAMGYYAIIIDDSKVINVTLMR